jgi:predicted Zn-dependent protease
MTLSSVLRRGLFGVAFAVGIVVIAACAAFNIYPVSEDQNLGAQFDRQIRANPAEYPILKNPAARKYVQAIVAELKTAPSVDYADRFPYQVEIINDDKTVNAFCTPGGYIYVYTGLIKMLDNEAALAGVLGHEIAHAELRHSTSRMTKQLGVQKMMEIALGSNTDSDVDLAANAVAGMGLLANSRSDEDEADEYSFKYLQSTKWYPGGIRYFFEKVRGRSGSSLEELFSTHPMPQSRMDAVNKRLKDANIPPPTEEQLNTHGYAEFKRSL